MAGVGMPQDPKNTTWSRQITTTLYIPEDMPCATCTVKGDQDGRRSLTLAINKFHCLGRYHLRTCTSSFFYFFRERGMLSGAGVHVVGQTC